MPTSSAMYFHMRDLIEGIETFSHLKDTPTIPETIDLNRLLEELKAELLPGTTNPKGTIEYDALPMIQTDRSRIKLLFRHLIHNGLSFNNSETPITKIHYQATVGKHEFLFQDNGIGIPNDYHEYVFGLFKRLHDRSKYTGAGLGLTICKRIVESLSGEISIDKETTSGTSIKVILPA